MPNTPLSKVPYPSGSDAPAAAEDMMALVMNMDSKLVLPAIDEADRDSKYADAPASSLCVAGRSKKMWMKTGPGPTEWVAVWEDTGWTTDGFVVRNGWSITDIRGRTWGLHTEIRGTMTRTGDEIVATTAGNIIDTTVVTVPPQYRPTGLPVAGIFVARITGGGCFLYPSGDLQIVDAHSNSSIDTGDAFRFSFSYLRG